MDFGREEWNWKRHGTVRLAIRQWNGSNMPYRTTRYNLGIVTNALASGHVRFFPEAERVVQQDGYVVLWERERCCTRGR